MSESDEINNMSLEEKTANSHVDDLQKIISLAATFFLLSGFIGNIIFFRWFNASFYNFYNISDYLSTSMESLVFALITTILILAIPQKLPFSQIFFLLNIDNKKQADKLKADFDKIIIAENYLICDLDYIKNDINNTMLKISEIFIPERYVKKFKDYQKTLSHINDILKKANNNLICDLDDIKEFVSVIKINVDAIKIEQDILMSKLIKLFRYFSMALIACIIVLAIILALTTYLNVIHIIGSNIGLFLIYSFLPVLSVLYIITKYFEKFLIKNPKRSIERMLEYFHGSKHRLFIAKVLLIIIVYLGYLGLFVSHDIAIIEDNLNLKTPFIAYTLKEDNLKYRDAVLLKVNSNYVFLINPKRDVFVLPVDCFKEFRINK